MSRFTQFTDLLLGKPLTSHEEEGQRVGVLAGIPMLGLDALGSASYGPEAALTLLIPLGALGIHYIGPISGIIIGILLIVYVLIPPNHYRLPQRRRLLYRCPRKPGRTVWAVGCRRFTA